MADERDLFPGEKRELYATPDLQRYFWIPVGTVLPPGDLLLRSLKGGRLDVAPDGVALYEIPAARAKELAKDEMANVALQATRFLQGTAQWLQEAAGAVT